MAERTLHVVTDCASVEELREVLGGPEVGGVLRLPLQRGDVDPERDRLTPDAPVRFVLTLADGTVGLAGRGRVRASGAPAGVGPGEPGEALVIEIVALEARPGGPVPLTPLAARVVAAFAQESARSPTRGADARSVGPAPRPREVAPAPRPRDDAPSTSAPPPTTGPVARPPIGLAGRPLVGLVALAIVTVVIVVAAVQDRPPPAPAPRAPASAPVSPDAGPSASYGAEAGAAEDAGEGSRGSPP
jgi:hypothetical protein